MGTNGWNVNLENRISNILPLLTATTNLCVTTLRKCLVALCSFTSCNAKVGSMATANICTTFTITQRLKAISSTVCLNLCSLKCLTPTNNTALPMQMLCPVAITFHTSMVDYLLVMRSMSLTAFSLKIISKNFSTSLTATTSLSTKTMLMMQKSELTPKCSVASSRICLKTTRIKARSTLQRRL